jgi:hypothetical protein
MKRIFLICLAIGLFLADADSAEFQVNTYTSNNQANAAVAMDVVGNFVVVWSSYGQDASSNGIFGQRFDRNCIPIGGEFQINTTTPGNQTEPDVAMDPSGSFIVVWQGPGSDQEEIFARRYDPNGQPVGDEFLVNTCTQGQQRYPKVALNGDGAFIFVWESKKPEAGKTVVSCNQFDVNGLTVGEEFEANLLTDCRYPDVAMDPNGNIAVVWVQDKSSNSIIGRLYNADGKARTEPFKVSTTRFSSLTRPSIAMDANGHFLVAWDGDIETEKQDNVHARLFDPNGLPLGEQFIVNTTLAGAQQYPQVAMNSLEEFIIVWESEIGASGRDIFARRYDSSGQPIGDEFQLNTYVENDQRYPDVAIKESGEFITVWQSDGQDGSDWDIFADILSLGSADFNGDCLINLQDFCILAQEWQRAEKQLRADLIDDDRIDGYDLAEFCHQWLISFHE